jgi:hypothetical protein
VNESRLIAEQQRKLILEGRAVPNAIELLKTFEESLEILQSDLRGGLFHEKAPPVRAGQETYCSINPA